MRTTTVLTITLITLLTLCITDIQAKEDIYRWVDKNGVVHFGDQPDPQADAELVTIQSAPVVENATETSGQPANSSAEQKPSYAQTLRDERAEKRALAKQRKQAAAMQCEQAKRVVATLEPRPRVISLQPDGTYKRMDDNVRLKKLSEAKAIIAANCN